MSDNGHWRRLGSDTVFQLHFQTAVNGAILHSTHQERHIVGMNRPSLNRDPLLKGLGCGVNDVNSVLRSNGRVPVVGPREKVAVGIGGVGPRAGKGGSGAVVGEGHCWVGDGLDDGTRNGINNHDLRSKEREAG
jgi:hypothetical protein